ncbi:MAG: hypothetical protein IPL48_06895 [Bacteroidetes bacterium]|nr:hypothetical protein [Bacteroidota bacterium]
MRIDKHNYEEWMVDHLEGNLSPEQEVIFQNFLSEHPELNAELEMFNNTFLVADESVIHPDKNALKKKEAKIIGFNTYFRYASAIAAALLLFVAIRFMLMDHSTTGINYSAEMEKPDVNKSTTVEVTDTMEIKSSTNNGEIFFAENKKEKNSVVKEKDSKKELLPNEKSVLELSATEEILFAESKSLTVTPHYPRLKTTDFSEQYASLYNYYFDNMMKKTQIETESPPSIVDRINNAVALANDFGGILGISKNQNTENALSEPQVKTTTIKIFDLEFYNRRKVNQ